MFDAVVVAACFDVDFGFGVGVGFVYSPPSLPSIGFPPVVAGAFVAVGSSTSPPDLSSTVTDGAAVTVGVSEPSRSFCFSCSFPLSVKDEFWELYSESAEEVLTPTPLLVPAPVPGSLFSSVSPPGAKLGFLLYLFGVGVGFDVGVGDGLAVDLLPVGVAVGLGVAVDLLPVGVADGFGVAVDLPFGVAVGTGFFGFSKNSGRLSCMLNPMTKRSSPALSI